MFRSRKTDDVLLALFEEAGQNAQRGSLMLRDLLFDFPDRSELAREILLCEQQGDRISHDIFHRLNSRKKTGFDSSDIYALTTAIDDIVDFTEQTADALGLYAVEAPMEQATQLAEVLVNASKQVADALHALRSDSEGLNQHLVEIHRLENEGDRVVRDAVASLFAGGIDPMVVIRWKDIYETLEQAVDSCEKVAHLLEGIAHKRS